MTNEENTPNINRRKFLSLGATGVATIGASEAVLANNSPDYNRKKNTSNVNTHGSLDGLEEDDHQQYLNNIRGDIRYYQRQEIDIPTALDEKAKNSDKNIPGGYCGLNSDGKVDTLKIGNFTSVNNGQSLQFRDGVIVNVANTYRRLDTEFGVVADGVANNATAIQSAFDSVLENNGGTLVFPNGVTKIQGSSRVDMQGNVGAVKMVGDGGNSVIHIAGGETNIAFELHNTSNLTVEGLTFIGTHGSGAFDFSQAVFFTSYIEQVTFRDCQFLGLSTAAPYDEPSSGFATNKHSGIVVANEGDLLIERCIFGGNATANCPNVGVTSWNGLTIRDSQFLDYGYYKDQTLTKTGYTTNRYWVRALAPKAVANARIRGKILIENSSFDEGNNNSLYFYGGKFVELNSLSFNGGIAHAIVLVNIARASIKDTFVGWINTQYSLQAYNCGIVQLDNLIHGGNVKYIQLDSGTKKLISRYSSLVGGSLAPNGIINGSNSILEILDIY